MKGDAPPVEGRIRLDRSVEEVWDSFADVGRWPSWNPSFFAASVRGGELKEGATLVWAFNPIRPWYLYKMPVVARVIECVPHERVTWEVRLPGFHAHHSYVFERVSDRECEFGSWEVAEGAMFRSLRRFWLAHFRFVRDRSLEGAPGLARREPGIRLLRYGVPTDQRPLVAIPGIDGSPGSVLPLVEALSANRQVVVVDYSAEDNRSLEDLSREIADRVSREVTGPVDILGQSLGSIVAAQVSGISTSVERAVLVGTFLRLRALPLTAINALTRRSPRKLYRASAPALMAAACGPVGDGGDHPFFATSQESDPRGVVRRTSWEIGRDFTPDIQGIPCATLVLLGARDRFVPNVRTQASEVERILDGRGRVRLLESAGHVLLPAEAVRAATSEIEAFLA